MKIVGIDPGQKGALALLGDGRNLIDVRKMPVVKVKIGLTGKIRTWIDVIAMHDLLREWQPDHVFIEQQFPLPAQGLSSTFTTAFNYGVLCSALVALDIEHTIVPSRVWKSVLGVPGEKTSSVEYANRLWPDRHAIWRPVNHGQSDAALIAYYGQKALMMEKRHGGAEDKRIDRRYKGEDGRFITLPQPVEYKRLGIKPH